MEQTTTRKTYVCKRLRLCRYLMDHGFRPFRIVPDRNNPRYNVYLFTQTPALDETVSRYFYEIQRRLLHEQ